MDTKLYLEKFKACFDSYNSIKNYLSDESGLSEYVKNKEPWLSKLENPEFPVAFIGQFSAGKSVVVNALIGEYILPENTKSTTAVPTIIKKSDNGENYFKVYYLDEKNKNELKNLYIDSIVRSFSSYISKNIDILELKKLDNNKIINKIEIYIEQDKNENKSFSGINLMNDFKKLINKWSNQKDNIIVNNLNDLSKYVVENENPDIILVDKVEVFLNFLNVPEKMVIVDLPGVGVTNPRHKKITENYIKDEAKAFVSIGKALNLIEGEEKELYDTISLSRKEVFKKAFWLINQWDNLTEGQKEQESSNFLTKIKSFEIDEKKVFKVSGLSFLLVEKIKNKTLKLSPNLMKHLDVIKKIDSNIENFNKDEIDLKIEQIDYLRNFKIFQENLFEYLNNKCESDFEYEVKKELEDLVDRIKNNIPEDRNTNLEELNVQELINITNKKRNDYLDVAKKIVNKHFLDIKINGDFLNKFDIKPALDAFDLKMKNLDKKEIKEFMTSGKFIDFIDIRFTAYIEDKIKVGNILEKILVEYVKENINKPIDSIKEKLKNNDLKYLSKKIISFLDSQSLRDSEMRAKGVSDILLMDYSIKLNKILNNINSNEDNNKINYSNENRDTQDNSHFTFNVNKNTQTNNSENIMPEIKQTNSLDEKISTGLIIFSSKIKSYIEYEWNKSVQSYLNIMIKNHYEDLRNELISILESPDTTLDTITLKLAKDSIILELEPKIRKISTFKYAYKKLEDIFSTIN